MIKRQVDWDIAQQSMVPSAKDVQPMTKEIVLANLKKSHPASEGWELLSAQRVMDDVVTGVVFAFVFAKYEYVAA